MTNKERTSFFTGERKETERFITNRMVVKIGTTTITEGGNPLNTDFMSDIARQASTLLYSGVDVIIVSSGAVACGRRLDCNIPQTPDGDREAALYGQPRLIAEWIRVFESFNVLVGQGLFTDEDINKGSDLLRMSMEREKIRPCVQIINANDVINGYEISKIPDSADNDKLAMRVASNVGADLLLLLSDVDGVIGVRGNKIETISADEEIGERIIFRASSRPSGMKSKFETAMYASLQKIPTVIAHGRDKDVLLRIAKGDRVGTRFVKG